LGDISFECYIVHGLVINLMLELHGTESVSALGDMFFIVYCFFITLLVGIIIKDADLGQKIEDAFRTFVSKKA